MSQPFFYCSELSRGFDERTYGTASTGDVWLLLEYPYWWGAKAFQESALSPPVKAHLNRTLKNIRRARLLFIKQDRVAGRERALFIVRSRETDPSIFKLKLKDYDELLDIDLASPEGSTANAVAVTTPLYLVCTHGKRDKCCAKFGYPVYKNLRTRAGDCVWQSSHVGGDRFAANLVCFPHGLFYAHATGESGSAIIDEYEEGRLALDKYRGRACYSHPEQAAEFFIRSETALTGLADLRLVGCEPAGEGAWRVRFAATGQRSLHEARVRMTNSEFQSYVTCHSTEEKSVAQYTLDDYTVLAWKS
ncbi:MAG: sucrase ferredoxin [Pyrinomonadaceae bacterium]